MSINNRIGDCREILEKLVAFEIFGGDPNIPIATYIKSILSHHDVLFYKVSDDIGNKEAIIARIGPEEDGGLILSGHMDVVPVKGQNWTMPVFILTEKDDKLYARGSVDMKGFLACCLSSIQKMQSSQLKKPIYFAFSYDEEIGCLSGDLTAQAFAKHFPEKPKYAIIGEPSMMQPVIGQKGICVLETTVNGSAGHSSRIKSEVSAINVAARLIVWLEKRMDYFIEQGILYPDFTPPHTSIHVGKINGGIAPNVIADDCSFFWDTRNIPGHDLTQVIREFRDYCDDVEKEIQQKFAGFKIITRIDHPAVPPLGTKKDASIVPLIQKITGNYTTTTVAYAAEAGQFSNAGFETVICGPGDIAQAHRADEFVEIDQLSKCLDMIDRLVEDFSM